jgi:formylglycine-generating enzyme required for sulfatase activity
MAGNVREWVADWFAPDYYLHSPDSNPQGPADGTERSLRSGSYNEDQKEIAIFRRYNHEPQSPGLSRGFRCAQSGQ